MLPVQRPFALQAEPPPARVHTALPCISLLTTWLPTGLWLVVGYHYHYRGKKTNEEEDDDDDGDERQYTRGTLHADYLACVRDKLLGMTLPLLE